MATSWLSGIPNELINVWQIAQHWVPTTNWLHTKHTDHQTKELKWIFRSWFYDFVVEISIDTITISRLGQVIWTGYLADPTIEQATRDRFKALYFGER